MVRLTFIKKINGNEVTVGNVRYFDSVEVAETEYKKCFEYGAGYLVGGEIAEIARVEWAW